MSIVEIGMKLNRNLEYYDKILKERKFINDFNCKTHDIYYTNKDLNGLTENEMKNACVRIRIVNNNTNSVVQNIDVFPELKNINFTNKLKEIEEILKNKGFKKIFDTTKIDHHYGRNDIKGKIQLQKIDKIGLIVYYDNPLYYHLSEKEQWKKLIIELNSYGFNFKNDDYGIDKLRTLYYKKEMHSKNQNS